MGTLPGRRAGMAMRMLLGLRNKMPPCVWAAAMGVRTISTRDCLFQCCQGQDSLHHYAHRRVVEQLARARASSPRRARACSSTTSCCWRRFSTRPSRTCFW
ncbi:unnamed protein product [Prorocentrum cordatum]|uniref:Secreted protein n=1 Tax=Prorocentrum cordatum TaxID=2364126 RepID=A0ABN9T195_9DINO|nr:unnamed protein product [Polarella glacialis]